MNEELVELMLTYVVSTFLLLCLMCPVIYQRLYADSPIDSSLFSLYIQQNYPQFCDDVEQCDEVADWLSWVDSSGGEAVRLRRELHLTLDSDLLIQWYQANPHSFHLLTLGTLHSLPSPVTRRSQKIFKPAFFDCLQREKDAWEGVRDTQAWIAAGQTNGVGEVSFMCVCASLDQKYYHRLDLPLAPQDGVQQKLPWNLVAS